MKHLKIILKVLVVALIGSLFVRGIAYVFDLGRDFINIACFATGFFFIPKALKIYDKKIDSNDNTTK